MPQIEIQVGNDVLEIDTSDHDEFVTNASSILHIVKTENAPIRTFIELVVEYARIGKNEIATEFANAARERIER